MQQVQLTVETRTGGSKAELRRIRTQGKVPAVIYGPGKTNQYCAFSEKELRKAFQNNFDSNLMITLQGAGGTLVGKKVILKSLERSPVTWSLEHADFYEVSMDRPLIVPLAIHFTGTPEGVKTDGGILQILRRSVRIKALPGDIPEFIELDISQLKLNQTLHISDLKVSGKITLMDPPGFALASVAEPEKEEVVAPTAEAAAAEGAAAASGTAAAAGTAAASGTAAAGAAAAPAKPEKK